MTKLGKVLHANQVSLVVSGQHWPAAEANRSAIDRHWQLRVAGNPKFFNGRVHVLANHNWSGGRFEGTFIETAFADFLAWREGVFSDPAVFDSFACGLVLTADGGLLLGRQSAGNLNSGRTYPPSGLIDERDIGAGGRISVIDSAIREVGEETGLDLSRMAPEPMIRIAIVGRIIAYGVCWRLALRDQDIQTIVGGHIARHPEGELEAFEIIQHPLDLARLSVPEYAELMVRDVFDQSPVD